MYACVNKKELKTRRNDQTFYAKEVTMLDAQWTAQQEALAQMGPG